LRRFFKFAFSVCALLAISAGPTLSHAQVAERLSQVKKIYVDSLGSDRGAAEMRKRVVRLLNKEHGVQVVSDAKQADAVVKGSGRIWVTGHVSLNPHSGGSTPTFGGVLSAEVIGRNGETLWSYLVSPSNFPWNGITDDLAHQFVAKLLAAIRNDGQQEPVVAGQQEQAEGTLRGAGATFPAPIYQRWFELFQEQNPRAHITYDAVGSAEGIQRLEEGKVDFGASEMPLSDQAMSEAHQRFLHVPTVLGAVVVIYNVRGVRQNLNFTPEALSGIFLGKIIKWNDPEIAKSNPGAALPDARIVVTHRSDGSGTTFVWTDYLSKISSQWKTSVGAGARVHWPVGVGAEGNEGVADAVQRTPNSLGYVEFIYAIQHELSFGAVGNAAGQFIKANISSVTAAAAATADTSGQDFRVSITNPPGDTAYPIATYTWLLIPELEKAKSKKKVLTELVRWMLTLGQKKCSALGYAPLPAGVARRALDSLDIR